MLRKVILVSVFLHVLAVVPAAQENVTPPKAEPKKTNERPADKAPVEPFDKADVKTMAAQCVTLDTESGIIQFEMFPSTLRSPFAIS